VFHPQFATRFAYTDFKNSLYVIGKAFSHHVAEQDWESAEGQFNEIKNWKSK